MATPAKETQTLAPEAAAQLADFARACKAAARAVTFYPAAHPAITTSLSRLTDVVERATMTGRLALTVLPDTLLLDGRHPPKADSAIEELAQLLHSHLVGSLTLHGGLKAEGWRSFFLLLARPPEELRLQGGIGRLWAASGVQTLELQEIDFAEILRERTGGRGAGWEEIIMSCLRVDSVELDEQTLRSLLEIAGDPERLAELALAIEQQSAGGGIRSQTAALLRMLRGIVDIVSRTQPERLEQILGSMAVAVSGLPPTLVLELLSGRDRAEAATDLVLQIASRLTDSAIAGLVARSVVAEQGATGRLAQAFQALVPEADRRRRLLQMAQTEAADLSGGRGEQFAELWKTAAETLTSYSDEAFVSSAYARELSEARTQALEVERVNDDPPERIAAWINSVSDVTLRGLDLQLLLDLLSVESEPARWRDLADSVVPHIEDLLLVGDFEAVGVLVEALVAQARRNASLEPAALAALDRLVHGSMMRHLGAHLPTVDERGFQRIKGLCEAVGPMVIRPLAEAVAVEKRTLARHRLTELLLGFGAAGRQAVERLKGSRNPAVRRTAIHLLREFGGTEALPDLTALLEDAEPQIQREALRAILMIGTEEAYSVLQKALVSGTEQSRNTIMVTLVAMRDDRAAPVFEYILRHVEYRGALGGVYLRAIEALGDLRSEDAIPLLREILYRGEWWAPSRTAKLRRAAALALRRIGGHAAIEVLQEAAGRGSHSVRAIAKAHLPKQS